MTGPFRLLRARRVNRRDALLLTKTMPSFVSLLGVLISAGQHPRLALTVFIQNAPTGNMGELARRLTPIEGALAAGSDFADALNRIDTSDLGGLALYRVLDLLRRGEVDGLDLATQLEFVVQDLRRDRSIALDTAAQRLTVSLLFPMVLCILPAFVLLAIVPLLLDVLSQLPG